MISNHQVTKYKQQMHTMVVKQKIIELRTSCGCVAVAM